MLKRNLDNIFERDNLDFSCLTTYKIDVKKIAFGNREHTTD